MIALLTAHLLLAVGAAALAPRLGSRALAVGALAPAASFGWLVAVAPDVLAGRPAEASLSWAPALGLEVPLRLDGLSLLLGLVVTGVGTLVLSYGVRYFADRRDGMARTAGVLVFFAGAMLALVLADDVLALYVAWELTTVCSFLLIGDGGPDREHRTAAVRALLVTTGAGFALLAGLLLLGDAAGTYRLSAIVASPPTGTQAAAAAVLVLVGAFAKSAQAPLHPWLPAAMVAPTPVSAYLHAAAMVKAGVYLVARLAPALAEVLPWRPVVLVVGVVTMLLGGWRALAQTDLKRLLAYGTIAQLGFLVVLLGAGTRTAALAGAGMLLAHAAFKATLFCVVGVIDHEAGTRDLRALSGVGRRAPALAAVAGLACLSMAGLPPTLGYLGKEAAFEAFLEPGAGHGWVLAGIVAGSVLTVAYTARFLWGAFADRPGVEQPMAHRPSPGLVVPAAVLAVAGVVGGLLPSAVDALAAGYADGYTGPDHHLALWHGLGPALALSVLTLVGGVAVHLARDRVDAARRALPALPDAERGQDRLAGWLIAAAGVLTRRTQVGSLPGYLLAVLLVVSLGPGGVLLVQSGVPDRFRPWDVPAQAVVGAAVVAGAAGVVLIRRRLTAVLVLSAVGYLVALLFLVHGAPDLALTQLLVETLTLLVFVLVIRRMPAEVRRPPQPLWALRAVAALLVGAFATLATLTASARHVRSRSVEGYFAQAPAEGGPNVVNVIISEFRALDTLGEVTVLTIAASGVASLVLVTSRLRGTPRAGAPPPGAPREAEAARQEPEQERETA
ncbi:hydrogen gas-evolving membrane-bound hydrogenase subunit E [Geodermatophilus sp. DSM 44513]|uniref:hydrogen gas-evolving membrane-bound hydrogenase subunit E n=1 Tax=Geodermatophilus sp. DSM 44513 TaxID=1528104 RepID=UPI0028F74227|nr:hydrogen gas-evolving membrane-bound hydrogenase subunit E [Geodermatophilus sp. DSM 44513]WNV73749.1 hydrogen gas-evolving membrane-bound hydrogenase subunit E [Geodermatophilus sp. DSM 44513]